LAEPNLDIPSATGSRGCFVMSFGMPACFHVAIDGPLARKMKLLIEVS
jgi:hypothetical protein